MEILLSVIIVGSVGLFFGLGLGIASKKLHVFVDPRISKLQDILPGANCGACGYPGCAGFAKALVEGKAKTTGCIPGGSKTVHEIADILGINADDSNEPKIAAIHCKGGKKEALERARYDGIEDCHAATLVGNGSKVCPDGCLGLGSCVRACPFGAIHVNENGVAVVNPDKCTGCEKCVASCPRKIISMIPKVHKIFLACANHERGGKVKKYCSVGCTACTLCVKATPSRAISMQNNLPVLDYTKEENFIPAVNKCPSNCFTDLVKVRPKANIDTKCDGCGVCVDACPVKGAIQGEPGKRHVVNKEKCIGCGLCLNKCHAHAIALWGGLGYDSGDKSRRQRSSSINA
ncbi:RnfABCDGE type electron transport complex subunit B [Chitinispirillales bacterium ANBcel5]|uniref:RnfABCDGE type electron transport complex subunit B n=1 Tax=Cellulosispirillum alkaliphilum TaxID=3039283 RepID=UPI002A57512C|nr:RnfABCDGE type electron transport complex subunit B [Chitinispirillales bacterium ANBcel5]